MRNPAFRVLLAAVVALALLGGTGVAVGDDATPTAPSLDDASPSAGGAFDADDVSPAPTALDSRWTAAPAQMDEPLASPSTTRIRIDLRSDRSARWTVSIRYPLTDETQRAAFETAGDRFAAGAFGPGVEPFEGFRREANRNVDRSMAIEAVERQAVVHDDTDRFDAATDETVAVGELRLRFTWTAFLARDGENLVLGDALTVPGNGTWLRTLEADQTLEVTTPRGYAVTATPGTGTARLADGNVVIEGPQTFDGDDGVAVVYAPTGPPWTVLAAAVVVAGLLVAGSVVGYRRRGRRGDAERPGQTDGPTDGGATAADQNPSADGADAAQSPPPDAADASQSPPVDAAADAQNPSADAAAAAQSSSADAADDRSRDPSAATTTDTETDDGPDRSLLSDEERVERLLRDNGGRMRQADIVTETGWSDAKVSQLLSAMADDGRVEKLRLGRENLISLPDNEPGTGDGAERD